MNTLHILIRSEMARRNWTQTQLAEDSGVPNSTISKILQNPDQIPRLETLDSLAASLDIPLSQLIEACGFSLSDTRYPAIAALLYDLPPGVIRDIERYIELRRNNPL